MAQGKEEEEMSPGESNVERAIGRLEGTITQQHETTRASITKLFEMTNALESKVSDISSGGCELGRRVEKRLCLSEKKIGVIMLVLASLLGIGRVVELFLK